MRRAFILAASLIWIVSLIGCVPKTEYDDKEIVKIETTLVEGFAPFPRAFLQTFDLQAGQVTATMAADPKDFPEFLSDEERARYNSPCLIQTFDDEQAAKLLARIKSLGFLAWQDRYVTTDLIDDGDSQTVAVYFADGTSKSTYIFFENPPKYKKIQSAFEEYLGVKLYY